MPCFSLSFFLLQLQGEVKLTGLLKPSYLDDLDGLFDLLQFLRSLLDQMFQLRPLLPQITLSKEKSGLIKSISKRHSAIKNHMTSVFVSSSPSSSSTRGRWRRGRGTCAWPRRTPRRCRCGRCGSRRP